MKALVYTANEEMTYREEPDPQAQAGEALIAIARCGAEAGRHSLGGGFEGQQKE